MSPSLLVTIERPFKLNFAQDFLLSFYNLVVLLGFNYSTFDSVPIF